MPFKNYPIAFALAGSESMRFLFEPPHNLTNPDVHLLGQETGLLALTFALRNKGTHPRWRFNNPYARAAFVAAGVSAPVSHLRADQFAWREQTVSKLQQFALSAAAITLMSTEIQTYYQNILSHAQQLDDQCVLTGGTDSTGACPLDYYGLDLKSAQTATLQRVPDRDDHFLLYNPQIRRGTLATALVWHIPGGAIVHEQITAHLEAQPVEPKAVTPAHLFAQAHVTYPISLASEPLS